MPSRTLVKFLFAATFGLAGFLLFQVQPMLAKYILPWFGGSATTWIVCMLFFQVALLAGYAHAYAVTRPLAVPMQAKVQLGILLIGIALLPITPSEVWKPATTDNPTWRIIALLAASVGVPYIILATTSPLLSRWLARIDSTLNPSAFFAASNLGSFVGLLSYPFIFERVMSSGEQTIWWSWAFVAYAVLFACCGIYVLRHAASTPEPVHEQTFATAETDRMGAWIFYSALGSILLLATTNAITQWSAVVPFLWIVPLSLYLLTFVIAFGHQRLYRRVPFAVAFLILAAITFHAARPLSSSDFIEQLVLQSATLFVGCMICHGEMVKLQPEPRRLPKFYLAISFGGALGGILVALVAPIVFKDYFEHQIVLALIGITAAWLAIGSKSEAAPNWAKPAAGVAGVVFLLGLGSAIYSEVSSWPTLADRVRNFYGVVRVEKDAMDDPQEASLVMRQAGVDQGSQFVSAAKKMVPACAFDATSGVGLAFNHTARRRAGGPQTPIRVGIIGLGAGMVAALGREGDVLRYYELNPAVETLVDKHFTFVKDGKAKTDILLGDGRLVLERQLKANDAQKYDVLVLNAFRGASPPMHLMTKEAFDVYLGHLAPDGILAINFELDTFEMAPLHRGMSKAFGMDVGWIETDTNRPGCEEPISWALYTKDKGFLASPAVKPSLSEWRDGKKDELVWTDKSSNLMSIINWSGGGVE